MKIKAVCSSIEKLNCDLLIINEFEGVKKPGGATGAIDKALNGIITKLSQQGEISGKLGKTTLIHTNGRISAQRVVVVGLGKSDEFDLEEVRKASASAVAVAKQCKAKKVASIIHGAGIGGLDVAQAAQATIEGFLLKEYKFTGYFSKPENQSEISEFIIVDHNAEKIKITENIIPITHTIVEAVNKTRDLVNAPSNEVTPSYLAKFAKNKIKGAKIFNLKQIQKLGLNAFYQVGKGSTEEARLIVINYNGAPSKKEKIGLVGKGITFDSGGISIKPSKKMWEMKTDMAGAAAVIEIMAAAIKLKIKKNIIAVIPCCENMPDAGAYKPGDVVKTYSKKTVEIISTDAEGRMIVADAMSYAQKLGANKIIDIATLTGGCISTLGNVATGTMTNDQDLLNSINQVAAELGEKMFQFPLYPEYEEYIKSDIADMKNCTELGKASTATGGTFLKRFINDVPWVHMDIAGTSFIDKDSGYYPAGATGVPVRTIIEWLAK